MNKTQVLASLFIFTLAVAGLVGGVYLVKQRQEIRMRAAPATTIYFQPSTREVHPGQTADFDILVDTNDNSLATVRLDINYDNTGLQPTSLLFNPALLPRSLRPIDFSQPGKITGSAGVDIGGGISGTTQLVASLSFDVLTEAPTGLTIGFGPETTIYSADPTEDPRTNLISNMIPAQVISTLPTPTFTPTPTPTFTPTPTPTFTPTPTPTPLPIFGDANDDWNVDEEDYAAVVAHFGETGSVGTVLGDVHPQDGVVDEIDYAAVIAHFGERR